MLNISRFEPAVLVETRRYVLETTTLAPALPVASLHGQSVAVVSDSCEWLRELCRRLQQAGGSVHVIPTNRGAPQRQLPDHLVACLAAVDAVVHLGAADPSSPVAAQDVYAALRPAVNGRAKRLVAAVAPSDAAADPTVTGVAGLMRSIAGDFPDRHVRSVELCRSQPPAVVARLLADEVLDPVGPASVSYQGGIRSTRRVAKPAPVGTELPALQLDHRSVLVVGGSSSGAVNIAARSAAEHAGSRLELLETADPCGTFNETLDAARTILHRLDDMTRLVVFLCGTGGVFGGGKPLVCAADDALDELAIRLDGRNGRRVVSVDFDDKVDDSQQATQALLHEMATLPGEPAQVVITPANL